MSHDFESPQTKNELLNGRKKYALPSVTVGKTGSAMQSYRNNEGFHLSFTDRMSQHARIDSVDSFNSRGSLDGNYMDLLA